MRIYLKVNGKVISYKLWGKLDVSQMGENPCIIVRPERSKKIYRVIGQEKSCYPFEFIAEETTAENVLETVNVSNIGKRFLNVSANC